MSGSTSYHAGLAAEDSVAREYRAAGSDILASRWRGQGGEIDLICRDGDEIVFCEVKKSSSWDRAAEALGPRQIARMFQAAAEYVARFPTGADTPMRFDLAVVDSAGRIDLREGAIFA